MPDVQYFRSTVPFELENGAVLPDLQLAYTTYGQLNAQRNNAVWVLHALTANADPAEWWPGMVGDGEIINPESHFIICANMPGSCYGSTGPLSNKPASGKPWYSDFPDLSIRDITRSLILLRKHLGIERIRLGLGGSMGGQQLLEWALMEPDLFDYIVPIATNARHSPWGIAFNSSQRMAIAADATWGEASANAGRDGLRAARAIALLSYRNYKTYQRTQLDESGKLDDYRAESYQQYQGDKFIRRFNAYSYWSLSKAMDSHDIARGRGTAETALAKINACALVIGISSDVLFPTREQKFLAGAIPNATYAEIDSDYGHDGFLTEGAKLSAVIRKHIDLEQAAVRRCCGKTAYITD